MTSWKCWTIRYVAMLGAATCVIAATDVAPPVSEQQTTAAAHDAIRGYVARGAYGKALQQLRPALEQHPEDAELHLLAAETYFHMRRLVGAVRDTSAAQVATDLAGIHAAPDSALHHVRQALALGSACARAVALYGRILARLGHADGAKALLDKHRSLLLNRNQDAISLAHAAAVYYAASDVRSFLACEDRRHALEGATSVERASTRRAAAELAIQSDQIGLATSLLRRASDLAPDDPEIAAALGDASLLAGESGAAIDAYRRALAHAEDGRLRRRLLAAIDRVSRGSAAKAEAASK